MARKRAKSMDQRSFGRSFWTVDAARAPGKLCRPPMASPEPGGMLAFAPFQGFIRGMSIYSDFLAVCGFSFIGLLLSLRALFDLPPMSEMIFLL